MKRFYTPQGAERKKSGSRAAGFAAVGLCAAALALCVFLCFGVRTANSTPRRIAVILISSLAGFGAIALAELIHLPEKREASHEEGVLRESAEIHSGEIQSAGAEVRIPKSISFFPVMLREGEKTLSLRMNSRYRSFLPPEGSSVSVETARGYIIGIETLKSNDSGTDPSPAPSQSPTRNSAVPGSGAAIARILSRSLACLLASAVFWSWIFNIITDTGRPNKITLFADVPAMEDRALAAALEENLPENIRMVQVHPFSYAMLDTVSLQTADLYLMTAASAEEHRDWLHPLPEALIENAKEGDLLYLSADTLPENSAQTGLTAGAPTEAAGSSNTVYGLKLPIGETPNGLSAYFPAEKSGSELTLYLCFGAGGYHLSSLPQGVDDASLETALKLLNLSRGQQAGNRTGIPSRVP